MLENLQLILHVSCWGFLNLIFYVKLDFASSTTQDLTPRLSIHADSPNVLLNVSVLDRLRLLNTLINNPVFIYSYIFLNSLALK